MCEWHLRNGWPQRSIVWHCAICPINSWVSCSIVKEDMTNERNCATQSNTGHFPPKRVYHIDRRLESECYVRCATFYWLIFVLCIFSPLVMLLIGSFQPNSCTCICTSDIKHSSPTNNKYQHVRTLAVSRIMMRTHRVPDNYAFFSPLSLSPSLLIHFRCL